MYGHSADADLGRIQCTAVVGVVPYPVAQGDEIDQAKVEGIVVLGDEGSGNDQPASSWPTIRVYGVVAALVGQGVSIGFQRATGSEILCHDGDRVDLADGHGEGIVAVSSSGSGKNSSIRVTEGDGDTAKAVAWAIVLDTVVILVEPHIVADLNQAHKAVIETQVLGEGSGEGSADRVAIPGKGLGKGSVRVGERSGVGDHIQGLRQVCQRSTWCQAGGRNAHGIGNAERQVLKYVVAAAVGGGAGDVIAGATVKEVNDHAADAELAGMCPLHTVIIQVVPHIIAQATKGPGEGVRRVGDVWSHARDGVGE